MCAESVWRSAPRASAAKCWELPQCCRVARRMFQYALTEIVLVVVVVVVRAGRRRRRGSFRGALE